MDDHSSSNAWSPFPTTGSAESPGDTAPGPEFLFHLYRGSELLKDDHVDEAKSELERALAMQPRDVEGQSLLGVVYFRLGHYPRAIQIYEDLVRARPAEIAPKINLALCYLKTGQLPTARALLEEVVQLKADHLRAWGYLGLAYQRLGDLEKACVAFERAGRPQLAERLRQTAGVATEVMDETSPISLVPVSLAPAIEEIGHGHAQAALHPSAPAPVISEAPLSTPGASATVAPGTTVAVPISVNRFSRDALLIFPEHPRVVIHRDGSVLVRVEGWFGVRLEAVRAASSDDATFTRRGLRRRFRGTETDEPLGGATHGLVALVGNGRLLVVPPPGQHAHCVLVGTEPFYVREERLLGLEPTVAYENGRVSFGVDEQVPIVQLAGRGAVIFCADAAVAGLAVTARQTVQVRGDKVLGWNGRMLPRTLGAHDGVFTAGGYVEFSGEGTVLMETK